MGIASATTRHRTFRANLANAAVSHSTALAAAVSLGVTSRPATRVPAPLVLDLGVCAHPAAAGESVRAGRLDHVSPPTPARFAVAA